jgi:hypothetical protein
MDKKFFLLIFFRAAFFFLFSCRKEYSFEKGNCSNLRKEGIALAGFNQAPAFPISVYGYLFNNGINPGGAYSLC